MSSHRFHGIHRSLVCVKPVAEVSGLHRSKNVLCVPWLLWAVSHPKLLWIPCVLWENNTHPKLLWIPCVLWALLFPTEFTKFTEPLAMGISYKKEATTKTAVASFYISTESEALLHANLLEQALCVAPLIHEEEHVADIHTDAASQTLVEPDVA